MRTECGFVLRKIYENEKTYFYENCLGDWGVNDFISQSTIYKSEKECLNAIKKYDLPNYWEIVKVEIKEVKNEQV